MATERKNFRLPEETLRQIEALTTETGSTATDVVVQAISQMYNAEPTLSNRIDAIYQVVFTQIKELEIIRDYQRELTENEARYYEFLYQMWEGLRRLPGFWEPNSSL